MNAKIKELEHFRSAILEWLKIEPPHDQQGRDALDEFAGQLQRFGFDPLQMDLDPVIQYACWDHEDGEFAQAWDSLGDFVIEQSNTSK